MMEWENVALGDCCKIVNGSTPSRNNPEYWGGEIHWFTPKDLSKIEGKFVDEAPEKITELGYKSCSTSMLPPYSLLFTSRAPIGHIAINKRSVCTNQGFKCLIPSEKADVNYLYYVLMKMTPVLQDLGNGATFKELSKATFEKFQIPLPPLPEQKRIATILDEADQLRQLNRQVLEQYDALTQSLFLEMFGDPVRNEKGFAKVKLGDVGNWKTGGTPSRNKPYYYEGTIPWLSSGELNQIFTYDSKEHITDLAIKESAAKILEVNSLLLGMYDTAALKSTISKVPLSCNQAIASAKLDDTKVNTIYVYYLIQIGKEHFKRLQRGVRQKNLNLSIVKKIEILNPPLALQTQFATQIQQIEAQKAQAQAALEESERLFGCLLQRAFKGEL